MILLAFNVLSKARLRRSELVTALGVKMSKEKGGLLSDKTLDERLDELTDRGFLESEMDHSQYPPAKYFKLTEKGKKTSNTLRKLIEELAEP